MIAGRKLVGRALVEVGATVRGGGCELRQLLSDDAHLLAIGRVGGDEAHLFADRRADSPARGGLAQGARWALGKILAVQVSTILP